MCDRLQAAGMTLKGRKTEEEERRTQMKEVIPEHLLPDRHGAACLHTRWEILIIWLLQLGVEGSVLLAVQHSSLARWAGPSQMLPLPRKTRGQSFPRTGSEILSVHLGKHRLLHRFLPGGYYISTNS